MSNEGYKMKEGNGTLFRENKCTVHRKGSWLLNGRKRYGGILESTNDKGEKKYELFECVGLIYTNSQEEKKSERSPDIGGAVTIDNIKYKFGGWARESDQGVPYTSIGFDEKEEEKKEEVPF